MRKTHNNTWRNNNPLSEKRLIGLGTPDAEPQIEPTQPEGGAAPAPAPQPQPAPAPAPVAPPTPRGPETSRDEIHQSIWHISHEYVKPKMRKALMIGSIAAFPALGAAVFGGDLLARNTIGKIPGLGALYNGPRNIIASTMGKISDTLSGVVTSPALALDTAENVYEGLTGTVSREARGTIGRIAEVSAEKTGSVIRGTFNMINNAFKGVFSTVKDSHIAQNTAKMGGNLLSFALKHPIISTIGGVMVYQHGITGVVNFLTSVVGKIFSWGTTPVPAIP